MLHRRLRIALFAAAVCAVVVPVRTLPLHVSDGDLVRPTFDSNQLVASLPSVLSPPEVKAGSRLVSMIAEDIDADGDLDVVANDGTLNLIVWTNDGSGRLSQQQGRETTTVRAGPEAPDLSHSLPTSQSFVPPSLASFENRSFRTRLHARPVLPAEPTR